MTLFALMFSALPLEDVDDDAVYIDRMRSILNAPRVNHTLELPIPPCSRRPQRSPLLLSLVTGLLHPDPVQRMTLAQLLSVPAIISASASTPSLPHSPKAKASAFGSIKAITSPLSQPCHVVPAVPAFLPLPLPCTAAEQGGASTAGSSPLPARPLQAPSFSTAIRRRFDPAEFDPLSLDARGAAVAAAKQRRHEILELISELRQALADRQVELLRTEAEIAAAETEP
jgi:hypothetical protein